MYWWQLTKLFFVLAWQDSMITALNEFRGQWTISWWDSSWSQEKICVTCKACCCATSFHIPFSSCRKQHTQNQTSVCTGRPVHRQTCPHNGAFYLLNCPFPSRGRSLPDRRANSHVFSPQFLMQAFEEFLLNYATVRRIKFLKGTKRNLGAGFNSQHNDARSERKVWWKVWDTEPKHFIMAAKYDIMEEANEEASINWLFFIVVKYEVERLTSQLLILQFFCLKVKLNMEIWKKSSISPLSWLLC